MPWLRARGACGPRRAGGSRSRTPGAATISQMQSPGLTLAGARRWPFTGDVAETRRRYHDGPDSPYGTTVDGRLLGADPATR